MSVIDPLALANIAYGGEQPAYTAPLPQTPSPAMTVNPLEQLIALTFNPQAASQQPAPQTGFEAWRSKLPPNLQNDRDYDLLALYNNNPNQKPSENLHFPDTYKKTNHITFSDQSIYHDPAKGVIGGRWAVEKGKDVFYAAPINVKNAGSEERLKDYFKNYEPGIKLVLPK